MGCSFNKVKRTLFAVFFLILGASATVILGPSSAIAGIVLFVVVVSFMVGTDLIALGVPGTDAGAGGAAGAGVGVRRTEARPLGATGTAAACAAATRRDISAESFYSNSLLTSEGHDLHSKSRHLSLDVLDGPGVGVGVGVVGSGHF